MEVAECRNMEATIITLPTSFILQQTEQSLQIFYNAPPNMELQCTTVSKVSCLQMLRHAS